MTTHRPIAYRKCTTCRCTVAAWEMGCFDCKQEGRSGVVEKVYRDEVDYAEWQRECESHSLRLKRLRGAA